MLSRKVEFWGTGYVETCVRFGGIMCICISEAYVHAFTLEVGFFHTLVIDGMGFVM
jgi:hypothetical protein